MTVSREELAAFADGQLNPARAAEVAAAVAADPALERQVEAHLALQGLLTAHYDPIAAEPVPDRFAALLGGAPTDEPAAAQVIDFEAARTARASRRIPRWGWVVGPALAASLALLLINTPTPGTSSNLADAQLASALDTRLTGDPAQPGQPQMLLSFARKDGQLCRAYAAPAGSGIACRDSQGWRIERKGPGIDSVASDYRQAGSPLEDLMAAAQDMASEGALDPQQEAAARKRGWR